MGDKMPDKGQMKEMKGFSKATGRPKGSKDTKPRKKVAKGKKK